jgi:N-acetylmuramoyl-L-alanine amidase
MRRQFLPLGILAFTVLLLTMVLTLPISRAAGGLTGIKVCIDPGHGGTDPGAVNGDLWESAINLDVAYGLKALLEAEDATVVMTRYDDSYRSNRDRYTFCDSEQATILVSVHTNSVTEPSWDGSMALYFHSDDQVLAQAIHDVMYPALRGSAPDPDNFADFGLTKYASGVLLKSAMPAAMMEPVFMSNPAEAVLLAEPIYDPISGEMNAGCLGFNCRRGQIALALHDGVLAYFAGAEPTPTPTPTPEPGGAMHVAAIEMWSAKKGPNLTVYSKVTIADAEGGTVPGAAVSVDTDQEIDGTIVNSTSAASETGADGTVTFSLRSRSGGTFTTTITKVSQVGWSYDSDANVEVSESLTIP